MVYGTRWDSERSGISSRIRAITRGRESTFSMSDSGPESSTETRESRDLAWLGITPGSSER